jgi:hypothetical protein
MPKTLYIHIGHYKTGTTALQGFLAGQQGFLRRHGLRYGETHREFDKHSLLAFALLRAANVRSLMHGYNNPTPPETLWQGVFQELRQSRQPAMILSSEEFMRLGAHPTAARQLQTIMASAPDITVRIIAYLRAPDSHLQSWFNQLVKMGIKTPDLTTALTRFIEPVHYDYALALRPWIDIFGADAVILRPYDKALLADGGLYRDFLSLFDLTAPKRALQQPDADPNPRLDTDLVDLVRLMQNADLPAEVIHWTTTRARKYLDVARAGKPPVTDADLDTIRTRMVQGLEALRPLPHNGVDLTAYQARLPELSTSDQTGWHLAGFLLQELHVLRQNMRRENDAITARLRALEEAQGMRPPKQDPKP